MSQQPYKQSQGDLRQQLADQVRLLERSADFFDRGDIAEAKQMATRIRVLVHDTTRSKSLLGQLALKSQPFCDTARPDPRKDPQRNPSSPYPADRSAVQEGMTYTLHWPYFGLVVNGVGLYGTAFYAPLDRGASGRYLPFDEWWNAPVFNTDEGLTLSRKSLILSMADQDGGAHVDSELDARYAGIAKGDAIDIFVGVTADSEPPKTIPPGALSRPKYAAEASVRQIAHEVLKLLKPTYTKEPPVGQYDFGVGEVSLTLTVKKLFAAGEKPKPARRAATASTTPGGRIGRNAPCSCGSGKKYKKCCGKAERA